MSMQRYTLALREDVDAGALVAEVRDAEGAVAAAERADYDALALVPSEGDRGRERRYGLTADTAAVDVTLDRRADGFDVRVVGDRGDLLTERVVDEDWGLLRV